MRVRQIIAVLALAAAARASAVEGPVAVMPFKNLNGDARLDWLRVGMAESMASDLGRSGRVGVVERGQIDRALAEIALGALRQAQDERDAARLGKLVGARTVIVGAFQSAGKEVRLSARFVTVETGVVAGAAKVTGPLDDVFRLQDQVVEKLLGVGAGEVPRLARRPPRRAGAPVVKAYEAWSRSLQTSSEAERVALLKQAVAVDPGFVYALDDLAALERRMQGYARAATGQLAAREAALYAQATSARVPAERARAVVELVDGLAAARRYHALAEVAERLAAAKWPAAVADEVAERVAWARFVANDRLHEFDLALQWGERYLQGFPTAGRYRDVESRMREIAETRRKRAARRAEYDADLAEKLRDHPRGVEHDFAPCIAARWNDQVNQLMLDGCRKYLATHAGDADPEAQDHARAARFFVVLAVAERGDFAEARRLADELRALTHEWDDELRKLADAWPTD